MPNSLTDTNISDTYTQLLHINGGVANGVKRRIKDGDGSNTALLVSSNGADDAVKGLEVSGTCSADVFDLNTYDATKKQFGDEFKMQQ